MPRAGVHVHKDAEGNDVEKTFHCPGPPEAVKRP
jgi:hypothetical protein